MDKTSRKWVYVASAVMLAGLCGMLLLGGGAECYNFTAVAAMQKWGTAILLFAFFVPIVEELVFRGWGFVPKGGDFDYTASIVGILLLPTAFFCIYLPSAMAIVGIAVNLLIMVPLLVAAVFGRKKEKKPLRWPFFIGSTVVFVMLHVVPYGRFDISSVAHVVSLIGLSSICIMLTMKRRFAVAVVIHMLYALAVALSFFGANAKYDKVLLDADGASAQLVRLTKHTSASQLNDSILVECGPLDEIAAHMASHSCQDESGFCPTLYSCGNSREFLTYKLTVKYPAGQDVAPLCRDIVEKMQSLRMVTSDTLYLRKIFLSVEALPVVGGDESVSVSDFIHHLRNKYSLPVFPSKGMNTDYPLPAEIIKQDDDRFDESDYQKYGISFAEAPYDKSCLVVFRR